MYINWIFWQKRLMKINNRNKYFRIYYSINEFNSKYVFVRFDSNIINSKLINTTAVDLLIYWAGKRSVLFSTSYLSKNMTFFPYLTLISFYEQLLGYQIAFENRPALNTLKSSYLNVVYKVYFNTLIFFKRFVSKFRWYHFIYIIAVTFVYKDITLIKNYLKNKVGKIYYKKYTRLLSVFNILFTYLCFFFNKLEQILGFNFHISGKISKGGDSKTQLKKFTYGTSGFTNKSVRLKSSEAQLWTQTGAIGIKLLLVY